jgi:hypothetical protein
MFISYMSRYAEVFELSIHFSSRGLAVSPSAGDIHAPYVAEPFPQFPRQKPPGKILDSP